MNDTDEKIRNVIQAIFGEQNLYRIDRFKYPDKKCKHQELYRCEKCRKELYQGDDDAG